MEGQLLRMGLVGWLVLAFLGGLILNIMPCVCSALVESVFLAQAHRAVAGTALAHGLAYTTDVMLSFVALAAVLFALRAATDWLGLSLQARFTLGLGVLFSSSA